MSLKGVKRKYDDRRKRLAVFFALFVLLGLLLNSLGNVYQKKKEAEKALARMEQEKAELKQRKQELETTLAKLETKEGLDYEIRKRFNVAAAGENVAIIVEEDQPASGPSSTPSFWQKIKSFFSDLF